MASFQLDDIFGYQQANDIKRLWADTTAPANPGTGEIWLDTTAAPYQLKRYNGTAWDIIAGGITVTSTGDVGIGTTTPGYPLHISTAGNASMLLEKVGGSAAVVAGANSGVNIGTQTDHEVRFIQNGIVKMILKMDGKVGIGTTTPGAELDIRQDGSISLGASSDLVIQHDGANTTIKNDNNNASDLYIQNKSHGEKIIMTCENAAGTEKGLLTLDPETEAVSILGNEVWHAGNDGTGSNLDADKLDGQEGSFYQDAGNLTSGSIARARLTNLGNVSNPYICSGKTNITVYWQTVNFGVTYSSTPDVVLKADGACLVSVLSVTTTSFQAQRLMPDWPHQFEAGYIYWIAFGNKT
ncbi:MAG: hypothetical protein GY940_06080 [bacterium]|nr:hypothetical protein [bacterium]